ncbi:MAG TPA: cutinase family protein [Mycobacterium sp.]|nr:cutinase family protein [Mycobacterium sp.]
MFRRICTLGSAVAIAGAAAVGLFAGTSHAEPTCPDVHWIGAAGSGERGPEATLNGGMGRVVFQSFQELAQQVHQDGRTMTAEAVDYPAVAVPDDDGGVGEWLGFMGSVDTGAAALGAQYESFVQRCPASKVVLAGYSQGAMVVHRNLAALAASPNLAATLLIADGDRRPDDPTFNIGSVTAVPGAGKGVAQDWPILAHAPGPMAPEVGARTISVCDLGDAVCDYDPDAEETSSFAVAVHTSYGRTETDGLAWTQPMYQLIGPAPVAPEAQQVTPLGATAPAQ